MRSIALLIAVFLLSKPGGFADGAQPSTSSTLEEWAKSHESYYAKEMTAVSPRRDGWMLGASMHCQVGSALAFDRDDQLPLRVNLIDLRRKDAPENLPDAAAGATIRIKSGDGATELATVDTPRTAKSWSGNQLHASDFIRPRTTGVSVDLQKTMSELPDGVYQITCEWPAGEGRPALATSLFKITLGRVSVEQARAAAKAAGDLEGAVSLVVDGTPVDQHSISGTLTNATQRPIWFTAYVNDRPGVPDAGDHVWTPLHGTDLFKPGGWYARRVGFCGTGAGTVIVPPGKSARLALHLPPRGNDIYRARVQWGYSNGPDERPDLDDSLPWAISDVITPKVAAKQVQP